MRRALSLLPQLLPSSSRQQVASYASQPVSDYSLVLKKAHELVQDAAVVPKKEIGYCAGVPDDVVQRKVRG